MATIDSSSVEMRRLRWRCRRGMRELDMLLLGYAEQCYPQAGESDQQAFRFLLTLPDPDILTLLTGRSQADDRHLQHVIQRLLTINRSDQPPAAALV